MRIIITENQNYLLRRLQQFIEIVEEQIEGYELNEDNPWWCSAIYTPEKFLEIITDRTIDDFIENNWDFFHDDTDRGGANMDISILNKIVDQNYGNYIRNLWVRKCGRSRF
jgi:hypothetical protein